MSKDWDWLEEIEAQHVYGIESRDESMIHRSLYEEDTTRLIACIKAMRETLDRIAHGPPCVFLEASTARIYEVEADRTLNRCSRGEFEK